MQSAVDRLSLLLSGCLSRVLPLPGLLQEKKNILVTNISKKVRSFIEYQCTVTYYLRQAVLRDFEVNVPRAISAAAESRSRAYGSSYLRR